MKSEIIGKPGSEAQAFWFINSLVTIKATPESTGGGFSLVHQVAPPGFATPYHSHAKGDEAFYVLSGEVVFFHEGEKVVLGPGGFLFVPGGAAHGFRVAGSAPAVQLILYTGDQFVGLIQEMGEPAAELVLPPPTKPDIPKLMRLSEKYGSVILGPLPE